MVAVVDEDERTTARSAEACGERASGRIWGVRGYRQRGKGSRNGEWPEAELVAERGGAREATCDREKRACVTEAGGGCCWGCLARAAPGVVCAVVQ